MDHGHTTLRPVLQIGVCSSYFGSGGVRILSAARGKGGTTLLLLLLLLWFSREREHGCGIPYYSTPRLPNALAWCHIHTKTLIYNLVEAMTSRDDDGHGRQSPRWEFTRIRVERQSTTATYGDGPHYGEVFDLVLLDLPSPPHCGFLCGRDVSIVRLVGNRYRYRYIEQPRMFYVFVCWLLSMNQSSLSWSSTSSSSSGFIIIIGIQNLIGGETGMGIWVLEWGSSLYD